MCMYVHIPVFFPGEDRDNRGLKDCDLYQSCILLYRLTMIVGHHHQLSNKCQTNIDKARTSPEQH